MKRIERKRGSNDRGEGGRREREEREGEGGTKGEEEERERGWDEGSGRRDTTLRREGK